MENVSIDHILADATHMVNVEIISEAISRIDGLGLRLFRKQCEVVEH
jgi:hypothetical protein